jgi:oxygen-dependent protoporphyrinogen oxidase
LGEIPYASVAVASYVYPRAAFPRLPPGSGFLVPPVEGRLVKAATFLSSKWGWLGEEAGPDRVVVRASVGRHGEEAVLQRDTEDLLAATASDVGEMTGALGGPIASRLSRWGGGLPQYLVGHVDRAARARAAAERLPALVVGGAAYDGVGVAACVAGAQDAAVRLLAGRSGAGE